MTNKYLMNKWVNFIISGQNMIMLSLMRVGELKHMCNQWCVDYVGASTPYWIKDANGFRCWWYGCERVCVRE